ncbi:RNA polymerase sigma factor [Chiayiivirga flava]|uniref:RNA polymerase sigma-70 factor (ECF subfamily) n=1 Tax=Chiayiivirga flava TaxID=659595 RepID=A0A7W8D2B0_9GAMM|nr:hypothetical protein [Chiayiivirga flava]MBB5206584.1 RNA polymerase sigma-70 factor (ECF subfamily) [Chiayiivirga flava]
MAESRMDIDTIHALRRMATRVTASAADADDLVQDVLLASLQSRRNDLPWLTGVLQRQAALAVRSAVRRRRREQAAEVPEDGSMESAPPDAAALLALLPPAARRVALLALHGLDGSEIRWILALSPAAFRQRLTSIRRRLSTLAPSLRAQALALAYVRDPARSVDLQFGLVRRALRAALADRPGLATHDCDGHLLVIRNDAHTGAPSGNNGTGPHRRRISHA